jgi:hypothetical protein
VVLWNDIDRPTTFVNDTQITAQITAADISAPGSAGITVFNPEPGGGLSDPPVIFTINTAGLEADVAPRPNGNGGVSISDWVQAGRFAVGLDVPAPGSEFQRADSAPRATFGNGSITIADWVQAGRYATGLDTPSPAAGPTSSASAEQAAMSQASPGTLSRVLRVGAHKRRGNQLLWLANPN